MAFADNLVRLREERNLSKAQMADRVGVHVVQYRRYEAGTSQPTLDVIRNLALTLSVSTDELIFGPDAQPDDEFKAHFQAIKGMDDEHRQAVRAVLDGLIIRHQARMFSRSTSRT